jgi:trimethylguanosine synthase
VEIDPKRLEMARANARVYRVADRIRFVAGDARRLAGEIAADLLFVDPPWGGRHDLRRVTLGDLPLLRALLVHRARFARMWAKVPPSFDPASIPGARARAVFGVGAGDARRIKFLLLELA